MKNTAQQVFDLIQSDNFSKISELREKVISFGWENPEYQEMTFDEACWILSEIINILSDAFHKNIFEKIVSFWERSQIFSFFQNINTYIQNTKNWNNQITNFIQQIQGLEQIIKTSGLNFNITGYPTYQEKLKQIGYLKQKYEDLISKLESGNELFEKSQNLLKGAQKSQSEISEILTNTKTIEQSINSIKTSIDQTQSDITQSNKTVINYEAETKQTTEAIKSFFTEIESNDKKMKDGLQNLASTITASATEMEKKIQENNTETQKILAENNTLQKSIKDILGPAIGTNLYKSFSEKAKWMLWQSIFWLFILFASIWFLSDTGKYIFGSLKPFFESGKITDLTLTFYLRLTLIFPAIYAVYFSAWEFRNTNKLKEEYDFKSSVAVALHYFKDLVSSSNSEEGTQKFLIDTIQDIFKSPTDRAFWKTMNEKEISNKAKAFVSDVASITGDIANKILPR